MRIVLARPDVSISLHVAVMSLVGGVGSVGAWIWYWAGEGSMCETLPIHAVSLGFVAILPWSLRRTRVLPQGRRVAAWILMAAAFLAVVGMRCRMGA